MKLDPITLDYLSGKTFSNGYRFDLGNSGRASRRADRLVEICRGQRVLDVGCCDHLDLIRSKIAQGIYLYKNVCEVATRCVGMDTNVEGISLLNELGFPEVHVPDDVPDDEFDICLLADVIEHVGDVVAFLRSMRRYRFRSLVVATPNAFRLRNFLSTGELINTDHRHWFSPYTLCKVLEDAGYPPSRVELVHNDHGTTQGALLARVLDWLPKYRDTLIAAATR